MQKTVETTLNYVRDISHNRDFDGSIERFDISSLSSSTNLTEVSDVEKVAKKQDPGGEEIRSRETSWINQKRIHWMFRAVEISMQRSKNSNFQSHPTL